MTEATPDAAAPRGGDVLVRGAAWLWTGRAGDAMRHAGGTDVRIRGGVIEAIGHLAPEPGEAVVDATGCVVYPGWVNTHHHLFQTVLKGIPAGLNLALVPWLGAVPVPYRRHIDADDVLRLAARLGIVELLLSGCTTVADHQYHYYPQIPFDASAAVFDEAARLGVRFVLLRGGQTVRRAFDADAPPQTAPETLEGFLASVERDVHRWHDPSPRPMRRVVSAITTPTWSCEPHELPVLAREARRLGIRLHSHHAESYDYVRFCREVHGCTPMQFVERHEWVGPDVWYAHMVHLDDADLALCARTGTGVAHCPQSNARLGSGIARVPEMLAAGVPVSLAVDGSASNEAADMISEVHACWLTHRADPRGGDRDRARRPATGAHRPGGPVQPGGDAGAITVEEVVHLGTAAGARMMGLDGIGTLQPGQAGDLAVYRLDHPRYLGLHDPPVGPVVAGGTPDLAAVLVAGRVVVKDNAIPGLDLAELAHDCRRVVRAMLDGR